MKSTSLTLFCCTLFALASANSFAGEPKVVEHVRVYSIDGRFGGWPANHGIWSWGDEIVVGFGAGYYKNLGPDRHAIDRDRPEEHLLGRSVDGGHTWSIEYPGKQGVLIGSKGMRHGTVPPEYTERPITDCPGGIDFTHPDFAMTIRMSSIDDGASRFYYSTDRAKTWAGPFRLPLFDQPGILARTDYLVNGKHDCMLFISASKRNSKEGRPLVVRTTDGGKTWKLVSFIGPEPEGYGIMPSTVRLNKTDIFTTVRVRDPKDSWIDGWISRDNGETWTLLDRPVPTTGEGNPPALLKLADGRLCITYGYRAEPFSIQARFSSDEGKSWSEPFMVRPDGAGRDIGYCRTIQRPDGKIVTVYYMTDKTDPDRYIAATIWDAGD